MIYRYVGAIIMMVAYGHEGVYSQHKIYVSLDVCVVDGHGDRYIALAEQGIEFMGKALAPGAFLVDVIPWCEFSLDLPKLEASYLLYES